MAGRAARTGRVRVAGLVLVLFLLVGGAVGCGSRSGELGALALGPVSFQTTPLVSWAEPARTELVESDWLFVDPVGPLAHGALTLPAGADPAVLLPAYLDVKGSTFWGVDIGTGLWLEDMDANYEMLYHLGFSVGYAWRLSEILTLNVGGTAGALGSFDEVAGVDLLLYGGYAGPAVSIDLGRSTVGLHVGASLPYYYLHETWSLGPLDVSASGAGFGWSVEGGIFLRQGEANGLSVLVRYTDTGISGSDRILSTAESQIFASAVLGYTWQF